MTINLTVENKGNRLDLWLSNQLTDISRSHIQRLIEQGNIILNNEVCTNKKIKVKIGDRLQINLPEPKPLELKPEPLPLDILYEDEQLIIINKPANLVVHPAPGHETGTLVHGLLYHCSNLAGIGGVQRPGIVHRLDKDTTGAMVVAKTDFAHQNLQAQIKNKTAKREYLGIIYGVLTNQEDKENSHQGIINLPIGRHPIDRKKMAVVPLEKRGREAITHWEILERLGNYSLVKFTLETGRTHQIRVHSSYYGNPIVGDPLYSTNRSLKMNLSGQALHAHKLTLTHPITSEKIEAIAPLPDELTKLLTYLRQKNH
ncbi:pseudouridine synthase [Crocosphaera subtropica ATCC 51142]|uniref:Pseudouridine synthase n=1 Tax=Crocosphaera subtropica (strain ATCC 51142 / BH68) TaxID=43989 RepID=B1WY88_CROS5|nr:RluA family pseudouridine synthase [Crocosphaera subtropica]ACB52672.1 pseudouridine synthase [Crocosphaera subtropica ATCC 51142]